jgi:hypothetical protein
VRSQTGLRWHTKKKPSRLLGRLTCLEAAKVSSKLTVTDTEGADGECETCARGSGSAEVSWHRLELQIAKSFLEDDRSRISSAQLVASLPASAVVMGIGQSTRGPLTGQATKSGRVYP